MNSINERTQFIQFQQDIENLALEALDEAISLIQNRLGVYSGDNASNFFSDDIVLKKLIEYIETEEKLK
jgi:hypothetical protein